MVVKTIVFILRLQGMGQKVKDIVQGVEEQFKYELHYTKETNVMREIHGNVMPHFGQQGAHRKAPGSVRRAPGHGLGGAENFVEKTPAEIEKNNPELMRDFLCMKPVSEAAAESMFAAVKVRDAASRWFWKCSCCAGHSAFFQLYSGGVMRLCSSCRRLWLRRQPEKVYDGIAVDSTRFEIFKGRMDFFHSSFGGFSVHAGLAVVWVRKRTPFTAERGMVEHVGIGSPHQSGPRSQGASTIQHFVPHVCTGLAAYLVNCVAERENAIYCWKCGENCCSLETNPYRRLIWRPEVSCWTESIQRCPLMLPWQRYVSLLLVSRVQLGWLELLFPVCQPALFTFWRSLLSIIEHVGIVCPPRFSPQNKLHLQFSVQHVLN